MKIGKLIQVFVVTLLAAACSGNPTRNQLADIESYIQDRPDNALANLEAIKANITSENSRASKADKAKFSLLYAMALDKNYIDTTDISIIEPAVEYYNSPLRKGLDKFMSNFYLGRIYENAGNFKEAIEAFLKAEEHKKYAPINYHTKLYAGLNRVYHNTISRKKAFDATKKECEAAKLSGDTYDYGASLLDLAFKCILNGDLQEYKKYLNEFETNIPESDRDAWLQSYYLQTCLEYNLTTNEITPGFVDTLNLYTSSPEDYNLLFALRGFLKIKNVEKASEMLNKLELDSNGTYIPSAIYYYKSELEALKGDIDGAYHDLHEYVELQDASNIYAFDNELVALEDKFKIKLLRQRQVYISLIAIIVLLSVLMYVVLFVRRKNKENAILVQQYKLLQQEFKYLQEDTNKKGQETSYHRDIFINKITLLLQAISPGSTGLSEKNAVKKLANVAEDKKEFVENMATLFSVYDNDGYNKLKLYNLSEYEVGVCYLILLGCTGKELPDMIGKKSIYNIYSSIRSKLGLNIHDGNLGPWLTKMIKNKQE